MPLHHWVGEYSSASVKHAWKQACGNANVPTYVCMQCINPNNALHKIFHIAKLQLWASVDMNPLQAHGAKVRCGQWLGLGTTY